jgi:hypothetical protein
MIEQLTPLGHHRANVRNATMTCINNADHLAQAMSHAYATFWGAASDIVLAMLNSNVPHWLDVLQRNTAVGTTINAQLDKAALPEFPHRVPVVMPSGYAFQDGQFVYSPPVNPEPAPIEND